MTGAAKAGASGWAHGAIGLCFQLFGTNSSSLCASTAVAKRSGSYGTTCMSEDELAEYLATGAETLGSDAG